MLATTGVNLAKLKAVGLGNTDIKQAQRAIERAWFVDVGNVGQLAVCRRCTSFESPSAADQNHRTGNRAALQGFGQYFRSDARGIPHRHADWQIALHLFSRLLYIYTVYLAGPCKRSQT